MTHVHAVTPWEAYDEVVASVIEHGMQRSPRGRKTRDLGFTVIDISQPFDRPLVIGYRPGISTHVAAVEAIQLIGGFTTADLMVAASPKFAQFREPNKQFWGAYGGRIGHQISSVIAKLQVDPESRQGVVTLWNPLLDNQPGKLDYPCTIALQFEIINDKLHMTTTMRSNDVWLGLPYDLFQFIQLQQTVARVLNKPCGRYRHVAWSMHLYEDNFAALLDAYENSKMEPSPEAQPNGLGEELVTESYGVIRRLAREIAFDPKSAEKVTNRSDRWFATRLNELHERVASAK